MDKKNIIERPKFDGNKENNIRIYINYLKNNKEEVIIETERKFWTNRCKEVGVEPFLIDEHVKQQIAFALNQKKFFDSMSEREVEKYIQKEKERIQEMEKLNVQYEELNNEGIEEFKSKKK